MYRSSRLLVVVVALCLLPSGLLAQPGPTSSAAGPSFRVGPGDLLEILVWRDEYLSRQVVVQPDGYISFPLAGELDVHDLTVPEIRERVTARLVEYLPDARVSVILVEIRSYEIYVIGKVNSPGRYELVRPVNVVQALALAESFAKFAEPEDIRILRADGTGGYEAIPFNYKEVEKGRNLDQNVLLRSGDVVVVP